MLGIDVMDVFPSCPQIMHGLIVVRGRWQEAKREYELSISKPVVISDLKSSRGVDEPTTLVLKSGSIVVVFRNFDSLLHGLLLTLQLVGLACAFGILVGIIGAYLRNSHNTVLRIVASIYVEIFRNTPLLVQLYFVYFALPTLYINLDPNPTALLVLTLNMGAYTTEIIRGGIESIHRSQIEAGYSLGMRYLQVFRYVILPPVMKTVAPSLSNQIILLTLASCLVAQISATDLFYEATLLDSRTFRSFEV